MSLNRNHKLFSPVYLFFTYYPPPNPMFFWSFIALFITHLQILAHHRCSRKWLRSGVYSTLQTVGSRKVLQMYINFESLEVNATHWIHIAHHDRQCTAHSMHTMHYELAHKLYSVHTYYAHCAQTIVCTLCTLHLMHCAHCAVCVHCVQCVCTVCTLHCVQDLVTLRQWHKPQQLNCSHTSDNMLNLS